MNSFLRSSPTLIWAILLMATLGSWQIGVKEAALVDGSAVLGVGLMVLAFIKVHLVLNYFMDLRHAPWGWRLLYEGWIVAVCGLLLYLYLDAGAGV